MIIEEREIARGVRWGFRAPEEMAEKPLDGFDVVCPCQTHTVNVGVLTDCRQTFPETDALVTRLKGVRIGVRTADCVPIVLYAPDVEAVAAVHAGWKGTIGGVLPTAISLLKEMGADLKGLKVGIGPHVCGDCYEVDESLASRFIEAGYSGCVSYPNGCSCGDVLPGVGARSVKPHLSLLACHLQVLRGLGISDANVDVLPLCTMHGEIPGCDGRIHRLPSWRRCHATPLRIVTWIGID